MKSLSGSVTTALASNSVVLVQLVRIAFPSGDILLNGSNWDLTWLGLTYKGAYGLGSVGAITDKTGAEARGIVLTLNGGDPLRVATALDAADQVQGSVVTIRTAVLNSSTFQIIDAPIDWVGKCDTMSLSEDGEQATIAVTVESAAVDMLKGNLSTYSDAEQQALSPGDRAFEYTASQDGQPVVWPSREFFFK